MGASSQLASSTCTPALPSIPAILSHIPAASQGFATGAVVVLVGLPGGSPQECGLESWSVSCVFGLWCVNVSQPNLHVLHCHITLCLLHTLYTCYKSRLSSLKLLRVSERNDQGLLRLGDSPFTYEPSPTGRRGVTFPRAVVSCS